MPRAFLITHRRYNLDDVEQKNNMSPEHAVSLGESVASHRMLSSSTSSSDNSSECPDELYNLTKLAEVAVATGQISNHPRAATPTSSSTSSNGEGSENTSVFTYTHKLFDKSSRIPRAHLVKTDDAKQASLNITTPSHLYHPPQPHSSSSLSRSSSSTSSNTGISSTITVQTQHHKSSSADLVASSAPLSPINDPSNTSYEHHECNDCGKKYSTSSNLARHRQTHRSPGDKKARRCPHCDKLYVSMPAFSMHVRTHNQGCKCQYCGKCFSRPWLLQGHIRTHTGEKPFKCTICHKAFADKSNLRAHIQTHSNTKPHICGRCGKAFALKSYLYKHEESSCMRTNGRVSAQQHNSSSSRENTPDKNPMPGGACSPTPVIVSAKSGSSRLLQQDSVIKGPTSVVLPPARSPMMYHHRSTVISPNPERVLYSTIKHPSVILNPVSRFGSAISQILNHQQDQPMDFSAQNVGRKTDFHHHRHHHHGQNASERPTHGYGLGLAITV